MAFAAHARHPAIGSTLSSGQAEVLRVLKRIDHRRQGVTAAQVARALRVGKERPATADVATVLDASSATYVTKVGSTYKLTRAGIKIALRVRARPIGAFQTY